jgi:hypothetical protein
MHTGNILVIDLDNFIVRSLIVRDSILRPSKERERDVVGIGDTRTLPHIPAFAVEICVQIFTYQSPYILSGVWIGHSIY